MQFPEAPEKRKARRTWCYSAATSRAASVEKRNAKVIASALTALRAGVMFTEMKVGK
jgi:hypothetical protein